jgi:hypothetical protein
MGVALGVVGLLLVPTVGAPAAGAAGGGWVWPARQPELSHSTGGLLTGSRRPRSGATRRAKRCAATLNKVDDLLLTLDSRHASGRPIAVLDPFGTAPAYPSRSWTPTKAVPTRCWPNAAPKRSLPAPSRRRRHWRDDAGRFYAVEGAKCSGRFPRRRADRSYPGPSGPEPCWAGERRISARVRRRRWRRDDGGLGVT